MSEYKICAICGGYIGNSILYATVTTASTVPSPPIRFCPGHTTTDTDIASHFPNHIMCTGIAPELVTLPPGSSVYPQHEEIIDTTSPDFAKNFKGFINKPTQQMQQEMLWEIVRWLAEWDAIYDDGVSGDTCCLFCIERLSQHEIQVEEKEFQHTPNCIVTKARTLMGWRKAQPRIEVNIKKDGE